MSTERLEVGDGRESGAVPPPLPPDDPEAWYAPTVRSQTEVHPGVIVTIRDGERGDESETDPPSAEPSDDRVRPSDGPSRFAYEVREPGLSQGQAEALDRIEEYFGDANLDRPRTREGAVERMDAGFDPKHRRVIERLVDPSPASARRIEYHALARLGCLGSLTPYALDDRIEVADVADERVVVHTEDFAPADTGLPPDPEYLDRFASERLDHYTVPFHGFEVPVVIYRENLLGTDPFMTKYAVREPDLLPGDAELVEECKARIWETDVEGVVEDSAAFVGDRARTLLSRQLTARNTRAWVDAARYRLRAALAEWDLAVPPVDERYAEDRLDDLVYYVLRDYVGYGQLTVPIRDPHLEDVEANRVGERVKVVPREDVGHDGRIPTNLTFEDESTFVNVVKQLAADDGTELNASNPSAKVNLSPPGIEETIRCAVALPTVSEDGPHISIRKQASDVLTPVDLLESESVSTELVALLWQLYESHGVVLFCGPTGVGKTTLMNAHMPFVPYRDRPVSIDEGSREVWMPHETGVSLTTRDHQDEYKRVTMADLMTETNYLNPDVELIAEINTPESFETFGEVLNTGHGVIGTTHAADVETLVNRVVEQDLPTYLLDEIDLLVFPRHTDGERYVGEVLELVDESTFRDLEGRRESGTCGAIRKDEVTVYWNEVARRNHDGAFELAYEHPELGDDERRVRTAVFERVADLTDRPVETVESEFRRKHRYVRYLEREGIADGEELFAFLADLSTEEAATIERIHSARDGSVVTAGRDEVAGGGSGAVSLRTDSPVSQRRERPSTDGETAGTSTGEGDASGTSNGAGTGAETSTGTGHTGGTGEESTDSDTRTGDSTAPGGVGPTDDPFSGGDHADGD